MRDSRTRHVEAAPGPLSRAVQFCAQITVADATTFDPPSMISPVACGGLPVRNVVAIAVAPAAMSSGSLSKSNSTSSPTVGAAPLVATLPPEVSRAEYVPLARLLPSTDARARSARRSQTTRTVAVPGSVVDVDPPGKHGFGVHEPGPRFMPPS